MLCPICGAASPTPGAAYIVSFICWISSRISRLRISFGRSGRAALRNTGSPAWTIGRIMEEEDMESQLSKPDIVHGGCASALPVADLLVSMSSGGLYFAPLCVLCG